MNSDDIQINGIAQPPLIAVESKMESNVIQIQPNTTVHTNI